MEEQNERQQDIHKSTTEIREVSENTTIVLKPAENEIGSDYTRLSKALEALDAYEPLHLVEFEPSKRYKRRHWLDRMSLDVPTALMKRHYGGNLGNINIIWKINREDEKHETKMAKVTLKVTEGLPQFHSRQMRKDFIKQYGRVADTSKAVLLDIYKNITGCISY